MSAAVRIAMLGALTSAWGCRGLTAYNPDDGSETDQPDTEDTQPTGLDTATDTDVTDTDTSSSLLPLEVNTVEPSFGSAAGGLDVRITGGPFDSTAQVIFGTGATTADGAIRSTTTDQVIVGTPAWTHEPGFVDVTVVTDTHSGANSSAFQFWEDGSGLTGALGVFELYNLVGDYWAAGTDMTPWGGATAFFIVPYDMSWGELLYAPHLDQCELDFDIHDDWAEMRVYDTGASQLLLDAPTGADIAIPAGSGDSSWMFEADIEALQYTPSGTYGLHPMEGGVGWPPLEMPALLRTPSTFQVTAPALHGSIAPMIDRYSFDVRWTGAGSGDYVLLALFRYAGGTEPVDVVTCRASDDGSFTVPASVWTGWSAFEQVSVYVGRAWERGGVMPHNQSTSGVTGIYWVVGAGFQD